MITITTWTHGRVICETDVSRQLTRSSMITSNWNIDRKSRKNRIHVKHKEKFTSQNAVKDILAVPSRGSISLTREKVLEKPLRPR